MTPRSKLVAIIGSAAALSAIAFIQPHEGTIPKVYVDPVGILTSCTGHTGPELKMGQTFTPEECNEQLAGDLERIAEGVMRCTKVPLTQGETVAYVSFAFNVGTGAYCSSTLVKLLNAGDRRGACDQLLRWTRAGGRELPGLVKRRWAERDLCIGNKQPLHPTSYVLTLRN